jgi:uncharacterized paraquat-inducible protein A
MDLMAIFAHQAHWPSINLNGRKSQPSLILGLKQLVNKEDAQLTQLLDQIGSISNHKELLALAELFTRSVPRGRLKQKPASRY